MWKHIKKPRNATVEKSFPVEIIRIRAERSREHHKTQFELFSRWTFDLKAWVALERVKSNGRVRKRSKLFSLFTLRKGRVSLSLSLCPLACCLSRVRSAVLRCERKTEYAFLFSATFTVNTCARHSRRENTRKHRQRRC